MKRDGEASFATRLKAKERTQSLGLRDRAVADSEPPRGRVSMLRNQAADSSRSAME